MNKKLTILVDGSTIEKAKQYAKSTGQSLSEIIENYLKLISRDTGTLKPKGLTRLAKLKGAVKMPRDSDYKDMLANTLLQKHSK